MKLEFLDDINAGGKYSASINQLVRLYDFDRSEACYLFHAINETVILKQETLDLSKLAFIDALNCTVLLRLTEKDVGLNSTDKKTFYCDLTAKGFEYMGQIIRGFCENDMDGYHWLYDTWENPDLSEIEFLISPGGTW